MTATLLSDQFNGRQGKGGLRTNASSFSGKTKIEFATELQALPGVWQTFLLATEPSRRLPELKSGHDYTDSLNAYP